MSDIKTEKEWVIAGQPLANAITQATTQAIEAVHAFDEEVIGVYITVVGHGTHTVEACVMVGEAPNANLKNIIYQRVLDGIVTSLQGAPKAGH